MSGVNPQDPERVIHGWDADSKVITVALSCILSPQVGLEILPCVL